MEDEDAVDGWDDLPFTDPIPDSQSLKDADVQTRRLANHLALCWAERMNARHGCTYSQTFWRNFLILWMVAAVQTTWRCYRNLELLVERHGSESLSVAVIDKEPVWPIRDVSDFMNLLSFDGRFMFWMSSLLLKNLAPANWTLEPVSRKTSAKRDIPISNDDQSAADVRSPLRTFIGRLGFDHVHGTKYSRLFYAFLINFLPRHPATGKKFEADEAILDYFPKTYLQCLDHFLEATLPSSFAAGFAVIEKEAKTYRYSPGRLTITHAASVEPLYQMINALAIERGERMVGFQHGGWYGTALAESWASESEYIYHAFLSWGWTAQDDLYGRVLPLPSPMLSEISNKHRFNNGRLIFVGTRMVIQNDRFDSRPSSKRWLGYRKLKLDFINALSATTRKSLHYRPYHRAKPLLRDGAYVSKFFPDIPIHEGDLNSEMLNCRLLVLDHPGTTLNLALAANVPTICYWNPKDWPFCQQAEEKFAVLRESGLLFDDPDAAAAHINAIWDDVPGWWRSKSVTNASQQWRKDFARTSPAWFWHWTFAIWKLALGADPAKIGGESQLGTNNTMENMA